MFFRISQFLLAVALGTLAATTLARPDVPMRARLSTAQSLDPATRDSLEAAMAKEFGNEIRIDNPGEDQTGDGAEGDFFGASVAISANTALIGVPGDDIGATVDQGSAYVFVRNGAVWTLQQKLIAFDGAEGDQFGTSVAVSADTAWVGAFADDVGANADQGSVHVFGRAGSTWTRQQQITAVGGSAGDFFGYAMAASGTTLAVGAYAHDVAGNLNQGSAYVFVLNNSVWVQEQMIVANDGAMGDRFAFALAIAGDSLAVGAPSDDSGPNSDQGSGYIFVRSGALWAFQQKLVAANGRAGDQLGVSASVSADTAMLGAPFADVDARVDQGAVLVFLRDASAWSEQQRLTAADGAAGDGFGAALAVEGATALVGAIGDDIGLANDGGSVYVFARNASSWGQQQKIGTPVTLNFQRFGFAVALSGETAIVGSKSNDGTHLLPGAHVFLRSGGVWSVQQRLDSGFGATGEEFGFSVALSGSTAVVGNPGNSTEAFRLRGSAYVFERAGNSWALQQRLQAVDGRSGDIFGFSVAISGDTIVAGARAVDENDINTGAAYVFVRSGGIWTEQQRLTAADAASGDNFGWSVGVSGDTAVVGAYHDDVGINQDQGSAYVFVRNGSSWSEQQKLVASDGASNDALGYAVAIDGNTVIVGADFDRVGTSTGAGSAYVFNRSDASWSEQQKLVAEVPAAFDYFGSSVAILGDTAVIGVPGDDVGTDSDQGSAYVFVRMDANWAQQQQLIAGDGELGDAFGRGVALSRGVVVVGASDNDIRQRSNQGSAYVYRRVGAEWNEDPVLVASDGAAGDLFGSAIALSGDVMLVGARTAQASGAYANPDTGAVYFLRDPRADVVFADSFEGAAAPP